MAPEMERVLWALNEKYQLNLGENWHIRCICHFMNRSVLDAEKVVKNSIESIRSMLKYLCVSASMRQEFARIQIRLD